MTARSSAMEWIAKTYCVPAKRNARVEYTGGGSPQHGTIVGANGPHLMIRLDGETRPRPYHPTWKLRFLEQSA